jgi:hypothetical protein
MEETQVELWKDMENMEERRKPSWIVKRYGNAEEK